jgi:hypothetical protein
MNDTPKFILQKQFEIIYAKPLKEKITGLFEMTELSRKIILNQLRIKNPELSEIDLKVELFKAFYKFDFDKETLNKIAENMKHFLLNEKPEIQLITGV